MYDVIFPTVVKSQRVTEGSSTINSGLTARYQYTFTKR